MAKEVSLNEIIQQIREWQLETNNFRNDSWTQDIFKDKLHKLYAELNPIINNIDSNWRTDRAALNEDEQK